MNKQSIDMKFIRQALLKANGITNNFLAESCPNPKKDEKGINVSLVNREINGIGLNVDYIRRFIFKTFKEKSEHEISYKRFWGDEYKI